MQFSEMLPSIPESIVDSHFKENLFVYNFTFHCRQKQKSGNPKNGGNFF